MEEAGNLFFPMSIRLEREGFLQMSRQIRIVNLRNLTRSPIMYTGAASNKNS